MPRLPPPTTFPEGQRALALILAALAGIACGAGVTALVLILWLGGWSDATQPQRLGTLALTMSGLLVGLIVVILGLLLGGPVGRLKGGAGKDGVSIEIEEGRDS